MSAQVVRVEDLVLPIETKIAGLKPHEKLKLTMQAMGYHGNQIARILKRHQKNAVKVKKKLTIETNRLNSVKADSTYKRRHYHLAYCAWKGVPYVKVEQRCYSNPDWSLVEEITDTIAQITGALYADYAPKFEDWINAAQSRVQNSRNNKRHPDRVWSITFMPQRKTNRPPVMPRVRITKEEWATMKGLPQEERDAIRERKRAQWEDKKEAAARSAITLAKISEFTLSLKTDIDILKR